MVLQPVLIFLNMSVKHGTIRLNTHTVSFLVYLQRLRELQDKTNGFNAFIPLKYKSKNNELSEVGETSPVEDLKNFAVARIFLDNIPHLKAYWPMLGKGLAAISLSFGVDDLDGTIQDTTRIYSMAGAQDQKPEMQLEEILSLINRAGRIPVERNSVYNHVKIYNS
jgi:aminodeoxyfutalosine synthase